MTERTSINRRTMILAALGAGAMVGAGSSRGVAFAEEDTAGALPLAEVPTTGGARPGPIRPSTRPPDRGNAEAAPSGLPPVAIQIPGAGVDALVERVQIVDGVMGNPSGPWVVSWYEDLASPGEGSNAVMAGHVDYWDVGPAVFQALETLAPGDAIHVFSEDETVFEYAVEWMDNVVVADLTPEEIDEIVGDTGQESLTLITCKIGTFDPVTGEYTERFVLRANGVS